MSMMMNRQLMVGLSAALLGLANMAHAQGQPGCLQTIVLRSGQVGSGPGLPGQVDSNVKRTFAVETTGAPLSPTLFTPSWFFPAPTAPAFVIKPFLPFWTPDLPCDPEARWINWENDASFSGSTLYEIPFNIVPTAYQKVTLELCWAVDDGLGDLYTGEPNPIGLYINGAPTTPTVSGGNYGAQTVVSNIDITSLVNSGANSMYFYQRDAGLLVSGIIFSAKICVEAPCETITFKSGQVGGVPGLPGQPDDSVNFNPNIETTGAPISVPTFSPAWFAGAQSGAAASVIAPISQWAPLTCDPDARWINFAPSAFTWGSTLYAMPINVASTNIASASISLCWVADDTLGDPISFGSNTSGVYLNGQPLPISGGGIFNQTSVSNVNVSGILTPGTNWLYFYQRDTFTGASGLIFSGQIDVRCNPCDTTMPACYADCDGDGILNINDFICFQTFYAIGC
jgi:hypothetical protein